MLNAVGDCPVGISGVALFTDEPPIKLLAVLIGKLYGNTPEGFTTVSVY